MLTIRIPKAKWGDVWFVLLEVGPITRIPPADDYLYIVSQKHIEKLLNKSKCFTIWLEQMSTSASELL